MEEFISNLIANSSNFIGSRTLVPGPMAASSRVHGPVVLSLEPSAGNPGLVQGGTSIAQVLTPYNSNLMSLNSSNSILRTDMSPMIAWLKSQSQTVTTNNPQVSSTSSRSQAHEAYTSEDYRKKIPKPYKELTERDCADLVAQSIRSIVLHTCNDEFRQQCLSKLGASNSLDVERKIKSRLHEFITQEEQQNQSDIENFEMDHSLSSADMNQQ